MAFGPISLDTLLSSLASGKRFTVDFPDIGTRVDINSFEDVCLTHGPVSVHYLFSDFGESQYEKELQASHQAYLAAMKDMLAKEQALLKYGVETEMDLRRNLSLVPEESLAGTLRHMRLKLAFRSLRAFNPSWRKYTTELIQRETAKSKAYDSFSAIWRGAGAMLEELGHQAGPAMEISMVYGQLSSAAGNNAKCRQRIMAFLDGQQPKALS